jgi:hypothetical protein
MALGGKTPFLYPDNISKSNALKQFHIQQLLMS